MTGRAITCLTAVCALCLQMNAQGRTFSDSLRSENISEVRISADATYGAGATGNEKKADERVLRNIGALQVSDALKHFSGVTVRDYGGIGGLKTVSVRGLGASHTAVAYDGVIITDSQTGQIDLGRFSASQTESVRMVSGPDNDMLQTAAMAAMAATVNIAARKPQLDGKPFRGRAQLKAGSFSTVAAQAGADFQAGRSAAVTTNVEWLKSDGDYPYIQDNGASSTKMKRLNSDVKRLNAECALYSSIGLADMNVRAYWFQSAQGLPANILYNESAARERMWNGNGFVQASLRYRPGELLTLQTTAKYGLSDTRYLNPAVNNAGGYTDNRYREKEGYMSVVLLYRIAECTTASVAADGRVSSLEGVRARPVRYAANGSAALKYASDQLVLTGRMNLIMTREHSCDGCPAISFKRLSPVIGANWTVWPAAGLHLRASHVNTMRLPTFNDLYFEQVGRRDLKPERTSVTSAGLAVGQESGNFSISVYADAYDSRVKDRILAVPGKNTAVWMMKNVGLVTTHGIETGLETELDADRIQYSARLSYTWQRAMDKSDEDSPTWNHQMPYTPRHSASGLVCIETQKAGASVSMIYSGKYFCNAYNGPEYAMPAYAEMTLGVWRNCELPCCSCTLRAECINLTDSRYELVRNYPMPGRQIRITATFSL